MKFTKTVVKSLVFATALSVLPVIGFAKTKAYAAAPTPTFKGDEGKVTVTGTVYWGVAKKLKTAPKKNKDAFLNKDPDWYQVKDIEPVKGEEVDLEKFKGKKVLIAFGSTPNVKDGAEWVVKEIGAADKAFKAYYTSANDARVGRITLKPADSVGGSYGYLSFSRTNGKNVEQMPKDEVKKLQVRKGSGDWKDITAFFDTALDKVNEKLHILTQNGANLSFRMKADGTNWVWGSKEAKVKVPAQGKAPKVKVDFDKNTISLKKDVSSYVIATGDAAPGAFTKAKDKMKLSGDDNSVGVKFEGDSADDKGVQTLYVKETPKKKMETKVTKIVFKKQTKLEIKDGLATDGIAGQGDDLLKVAEKVKFELVNKFNVQKGAVIKNLDTTNDYEFAIDYDGTGTTPLKWVKLKKAKEAEKPTTVKVTCSKTKKANAFKEDKTSKIYLRLPGIKQVGNEVTMPSPSISALIKVEALPQVMTITTTTAGGFTIVAPDKLVFTLDVAEKTAKTYVVAAKITNFEKRKGSPKLTLSSEAIPGVTVSAGKFTESGDNDVTFEITVDVKNTAFSTGSLTTDKTLKFKVNAEKIVDKEYTITFKKAVS